MKKSLSLLLALAMVFSMFASVAFAADNTAPQTALEKFNFLKDKQIFSGINDAGDPGLDQNMTRAQAAVIIAKLFNLDTTNPPATATFKDVPTSHWANAYVEAAVKAGIIHGVSATKFDDKADVTTQDLAVMLVLGFQAQGLQVDENATVDGTVKPYAVKYVAAAIANGLIPAADSYTQPALREALVNATYASYLQVGQQFGEVAISSLTATGASKLTVAFNKAVDKAKATIKVTKGSIDQTIDSKTFADDNKSAVIALGAKLMKGDYTVTVSGLTDTALTKTVTVEDEKVAKLEITGDTAPLDASGNDKVHVSYKVYNQYNEDVTATASGNVTITPSLGTVSSNSNGAVTVTKSTYANDYYVGQSLFINALYVNTSTGVSVNASKELKVGLPSKVAAVELKGIAGDKTLDDSITGSAGDDINYYLVINVKDQYGNDVTDETRVKDEISVNSTNPYVVDVNLAHLTTEYVDGNAQLRVPFKLATGQTQLHAGTAEIFAIPKYVAGTKATYSVTVGQSSKVASITLSAPSVAVGGEDIKIPVTAYDQDGKAITDIQKLNDAVLSAVPSFVSFTSANPFKKDYSNNSVYLALTAPSVPSVAQPASVNLTLQPVGGTSPSAFINFNVQPDKYAVAVKGDDAINKALAVDATTDFNNDEIKVVDQYGRTKNLSDFDDSVYTVKVSSTNTAYADFGGSANKTVNNSGTKTATLTAKAKGTTGIKFELIKTTGGSSSVVDTYNTSVRVVGQDEIADYTVDDIGKVYGGAGGSSSAPGYAQAVAVTGLLSDGTKVTVPTVGTSGSNDYYTVVTSSVYGPSLAVNADGKLYVNNLNSAVDANASKDYTVVVYTVTKDGAKPFPKKVTVSTVLPGAETLTLRDIDTATYTTFTSGTAESDGVESIDASSIHGKTAKQIANAAVKVVDQYGIEMSDSVKFTQAYESGFSDHALNSVIAGDSFYITAITANGKYIKFQVQVK